MDYEYLKSLFDGGALTFEQLVAALGTHKEIKLVNLADGGYVAKEKHDNKVKELTTELEGVKGQLTEANTTIQSYKDMDIDGIKKSATEWQQKYETDTKSLKEKLDAQATEFAARTYLAGYQYTDDLVKDAIYAKFMAKAFRRSEDGKFEGADSWMEEMQKTYPGSFAASNPAADPAGTPPAGGGTPVPNSPSGAPAGAPPAGKPRPWFAPPAGPSGTSGGKKMTLSEMMAFKNDHPDAKIDFE